MLVVKFPNNIFFKEFEFIVETGKIREYAKALGLEDPVYTDVEAANEAGYPNLVAPPTFTRQFWFDDDENDPMRHLGFDLGRRLLGGYSFEYVKPNSKICRDGDPTQNNIYLFKKRASLSNFEKQLNAELLLRLASTSKHTSF